jgi:hypothetical protein
VLNLLADRGLSQGKRIGIDATTLEANAAMKSIVRRDTGESYNEFLTGLAMESGAVVAVTLQAADLGDTTTVHPTLAEAGLAVAELVGREVELYLEEEPKVNVNGIEELAADKGYHSGAVLEQAKELEVSTYIPERKQAGKRNWEGKQSEQQAVEENQSRVTGD